MGQTLQIVILSLLLVMLSVGVFVLILIWRALLGRTLINAKLSAEMNLFSKRMEAYVKQFSELNGEVRDMNRSLGVTSDVLRKLPKEIAATLKEYVEDKS